MRERYWDMFYKIAFQFFYYKRFQILFKRINWIISIFCSLVSLSSIAAWGIWKSYPVLWSSLICASQLIQALFPKLPYNDLLVSTKFMICSLDKLLLNIDHNWLYIETSNCSEKKILKLIEKYEAKYHSLVEQFYSGEYLPEIPYCEKKAEKECADYFRKYLSS